MYIDRFGNDGNEVLELGPELEATSAADQEWPSPSPPADYSTWNESMHPELKIVDEHIPLSVEEQIRARDEQEREKQLWEQGVFGEIAQTPEREVETEIEQPEAVDESLPATAASEDPAAPETSNNEPSGSREQGSGLPERAWGADSEPDDDNAGIINEGSAGSSSVKEPWDKGEANHPSSGPW